MPDTGARVRGRRPQAPGVSGGARPLCARERPPGALLIKVGTLDDPAVFGTPQMAIFAFEKQSFHRIPEGVPAFSRGPGSPAAS